MISWIGLDWVSKNGPMSQLSDPASWYMLSRDANVASCPYWVKKSKYFRQHADHTIKYVILKVL